MSQKDSAEDKLIASIKKTRAGKSTAKKAPAKKSAKKQNTAGASKKPAVSRSSPSTRERKQVLVDLFQSGRRVWPD